MSLLVIAVTVYGMQTMKSISVVDEPENPQAVQMYKYIPVQMGDDGVPIVDSTKWDKNSPFMMMPVPIQ